MYGMQDIQLRKLLNSISQTEKYGMNGHISFWSGEINVKSKRRKTGRQVPNVIF